MSCLQAAAGSRSRECRIGGWSSLRQSSDSEPLRLGSGVRRIPSMNDGSPPPNFTDRCYRHPDRTTFLRCSRCDRAICGFCSFESPVGQRCPECIGGVVTRVAPTRRLAMGITPAVLAIIVISVLAHLWQRLDPQVTADFAHVTVFVQLGDWWRVITAAFLHSPSSILHLLFNMYALYLFGPGLERRVGTTAFVGLYLASAIAGGVAFQYLSYGAAVGASGAIFGLFGAVLVGTLPMRRTAQGALQLRRLLLLLGLNLALSLLVRSIAWEAHVGGLVMGMIVVWMWQRIPPTPQAHRQRVWVVYGLALLGLAAVALA